MSDDKERPELRRTPIGSVRLDHCEVVSSNVIDFLNELAQKHSMRETDVFYGLLAALAAEAAHRQRDMRELMLVLVELYSDALTLVKQKQDNSDPNLN